MRCDNVSNNGIEPKMPRYGIVPMSSREGRQSLIPRLITMPLLILKCRVGLASRVSISLASFLPSDSSPLNPLIHHTTKVPNSQAQTRIDTGTTRSNTHTTWVIHLNTVASTSTNILCTCPSCPLTLPHNEGSYDFIQVTKDTKSFTNILPSDINEIAARVIKRCSKAGDWEILAQFTAAHNSFHLGLLPKQVRIKLWGTKKIAAIFQAGDKLTSDRMLALANIEKAKKDLAKLERGELKKLQMMLAKGKAVCKAKAVEDAKK